MTTMIATCSVEKKNIDVRASQVWQNDVNFSFVAPSSEELWVRKEI